VTTDRLLTAVCYDAARGVSYPRPRLRGVLHQVSFAVSLMAGALLVTAAPGIAAKIAASVHARPASPACSPSAPCITGSVGRRRHPGGCNDSTTP
jgi:hypothetical protein